MTPYRWIAAALVAVVAMLAVVFLWNDGEEDRLPPVDRAALLLGQRVYGSTCAACHGKNLEGQADWQSPGADGRMPAPPHDASGHTWHHADGLLFDIVKFGMAKAVGLENYDSAMPAYEDMLTDSEIRAVLTWIKSTWPEEIRAPNDQLNAQAAEDN